MKAIKSMDIEEREFIINVVNKIISGNITESFKIATPESRTAIIFSLVSAHRLSNDPLYLDLAENLIDLYFKQFEDSKPESITEFEDSQIRNAFFNSALLYIYDFSRNNKYLDYSNIELEYLTSIERKRTKDQGHLSYFKNKSELFAENSYLVYPFLIKIASIKKDSLLMSKSLNEYLALIHQLRDDQTGLFYSIFKKRLFKYDIHALPYFSSISNAYIFASLAENINILKSSIGFKDFKQKEIILERYAIDLTENLLKVQDPATGLFPYEIIFNLDKDNQNHHEIVENSVKSNIKYDLANTILIFNVISRLVQMEVLPNRYIDIVKKNYHLLKTIINSDDPFYENPKYLLDTKQKYKYTSEDIKYLSICNILFLSITLEKVNVK